ncbi:MAG TPA: methyltransferase domain-containing protein [Bryobacteraceae bacterium]|nr:methyltransferase domain-containing protein [Bryobacteraceae bacterium]
MDLAAWEQRYRAQEEISEPSPNPLLVEAARSLPPGRALDLACGTGRNALWLAQHGWNVTAVDGSPTAIELLRQRAGDLPIATQIADLENGAYAIEPGRYDLIAICYYLERKLFEPAKRGLIPGGILVAIALLAEPGKDNSFRVEPGELPRTFEGWEILHHREGRDAWQHNVAEIVARKPF